MELILIFIIPEVFYRLFQDFFLNVMIVKGLLTIVDGSAIAVELIPTSFFWLKANENGAERQ